MLRKYRTIDQIQDEHPQYALYILISPGGSAFHWHISQPKPKGKYAFLGGI